MPPYGSQGGRLPELAEGILTELLRSGAGYWEGARTWGLQDVQDWFAGRPGAAIMATLEQLHEEGYTSAAASGIQLTELGCRRAQAVLNAAQEDPLASLEIRPPEPPAWMPFPVDNPRNTEWAGSKAFEKDVKGLDPSLHAEAAKEMALTLADPDRGKPLRKDLHGLHQSKFHKDYRLRWTPGKAGDVEFNRIAHKNDVK